MTGGHVVFYLACYSYIADVSEPEQRTKRMALLDGCFPVGFYTGMALSGIIERDLGFMANFGCGMVMALAAVIYTIVFIKDSRPIRDARILKMQQREIEMMPIGGNDREISSSKFCMIGDISSDCFNIQAFSTHFYEIQGSPDIYNILGIISRYLKKLFYSLKNM